MSFQCVTSGVQLHEIYDQKSHTFHKRTRSDMINNNKQVIQMIKYTFYWFKCINVMKEL